MSETGGAVVVGVDGTAHGDAALAFAADEARRCGDSLQVVTAWQYEVRAPAPNVMPMPLDTHAYAEQEQAAALARAGDLSDLVVAREMVEGEAGPALVEAARGARLLVVGSRSLGPVRAALLGSVSRYCAQHAPCPVVVVPGAPAEGEVGALAFDISEGR
jgi:nucleotide-binding universal stress UspA family protein